MLAGCFSRAAAQGPEFLKDINPGEKGSFFAFRVESKEYAEINGQLIFLARHEEYGLELWHTDGTAQGTQLLKDINPRGSAFPGSPNFTRLGNYIYFFADDGQQGLELWRTDGTEANTQLVQDLNPGPPPSVIAGFDSAYITTYGGELYFGATNGTESGLFKSNGQPGQITLVKSIESRRGLAAFAVSNNQLFFSGDDHIWKSDGTPAGTVSVSEDVFFEFGWSIDVNGTLLFTANDQPRGRNFELWRTDGTEEGTTKIREVLPDPLDGGTIPTISPVAIGNILYFAGNDGNSKGGGLWQSDGTRGGTRKIKEFNREVPRYLTRIGNTLIFNGHDGPTGSEPWIYRTDGTGVNLIADLITRTGSSSPTLFTAVDGKAYFSASCGTESVLFETDGTEENTFQVSGNFPNQARGAMRLGNQLIYWQDSGDGQGFELWKYDSSQGRLFGPVPNISITAEGETELCPDETLVLRATEVTGASYIWTRGGREIARSKEPTTTVKAEGRYTVRVERSCFTRKESADTINVVANFSPDRPTLTAPQGTVLCTGTQLPLSITPQPGTDYVLKRDGELLDIEVAQTFEVTEAGTYTVEATNVCSTVISNSLVISELTSLRPEISSAGPSALCAEGSVVLETLEADDVQYYWLLDGDTLDVNQNYLVAEEVGTYSVVLKGFCGSVSSEPFRVEASELPDRPTIAAQEGSSLCQQGEVVLEVANADGWRYQWIKDGAPVPEATTSQYTVTDAGIYEVEISNGCGSVLSGNQIPITGEGTLASPFAEAVESCAGQSVTLMAQGGAEGSYRWYDSPEASVPLPDQNLSSFTTPVLLESTTFYVATVSGACESERVAVPVTVRDALVADAGEDQTILIGQSVTLQGSGGADARWEPAAGLSNPTSYQPEARPEQTTTYTLTVTSEEGCVSTDEVTIIVDESLDIPDAFTPNNDGVNDAWVIEGLEQFPNCEVLVHNRWGVRVFQSRGYAVPWSGTAGGNVLPADTYFYKIDFHNDRQANLTGYVAIIR